MTRNNGDDVAADRRLLATFNGSPVVDGSNALSIQEEGRACSQKLPGLCYPRSRRGTGESESCHACQVGEATHYWVRSDQFSGCNAQE